MFIEAVNDWFLTFFPLKMMNSFASLEQIYNLKCRIFDFLLAFIQPVLSVAITMVKKLPDTSLPLFILLTVPYLFQQSSTECSLQLENWDSWNINVLLIQ